MADVKLQSTKILSPSEEKTIDKTLEDFKNIRDEVEIAQGVNFEAKSKDNIDNKIADLERIRANNSLPILSEAERQRAKKELDILTADLQKDMPTWTEYERLRPRDGSVYTSLVKQIVKWEADPIRRQKVQRWKVLRRLVDPSDPQAGDMRYLFPQ